MTETEFAPPAELDPLLSEEGELVTPADDPDTGDDDGDDVRPSDDDELENDPEQDDEPPGAGGDEQEPSAAAVIGLTEKQLEQLGKKLDAGAETWRKRVRTLLGEETFAALTLCELCGSDIPGYHYPPEVLQPETELEARLVNVLLAPEGPNYIDDPELRQCTACGGLGRTKTGSRVPKRETTGCRACRGFGFVPPPDAPNAPAGLEADGAAELDGAEPLAAAEDTDAWGSPRHLPDGQENPNWGRMPQYKDGAYP